jgi:dynein heavy chain, axonemal
VSLQVVLNSLLELQPNVGQGAQSGGRSEDVVAAIANDLLDQVPPPFNLEQVMKAKADDPSALHVILFQEVERYNMLLVRIRKSCAELLKGVKGLAVMSAGTCQSSAASGQMFSRSSCHTQAGIVLCDHCLHADLESMVASFLNGKVPPSWLRTYPSLKPLGSWTRDLLKRIDQFATWVEGTYPLVYWLSGFTYPTGFLTAVLQTTARKKSVPIDMLSFDYSITNVDPREITSVPKEGVHVQGIYLEGAGWDLEEVRRSLSAAHDTKTCYADLGPPPPSLTKSAAAGVSVRATADGTNCANACDHVQACRE